MQPSKYIRARRGFTFIELCLGMIVTAMIASALAAFTLAVANCWRQADETPSSSIMANQLMQRMYGRLHSAKRIGAWRSGQSGPPAALIYWSADSNGDGLMQYSELGGLLYNGTDKTIDYYKPVLAGGAPDQTWTQAEFTDGTSIDKFVEGLTAQPLLRHVDGAWLNVEFQNDASNAPVVQWQVQILNKDGTNTTAVGMVTLRAAM